MNCEYLPFKTPILHAGKDSIHTSTKLIYLQSGNSYVCTINCNLLPPHIVMSFVLSSNPFDPTGKEPNTILFRNGVTGSAAEKQLNRKTKWFYHGIPLYDIENIKITITDQYTISYQNKAGVWVIHGTTPVSMLTVKKIGNVQGIPFYFNVVLNNKCPKIPYYITAIESNDGVIFEYNQNPDSVQVSAASDSVSAASDSVSTASDSISAASDSISTASESVSTASDSVSTASVVSNSEPVSPNFEQVASNSESVSTASANFCSIN